MRVRVLIYCLMLTIDGTAFAIEPSKDWMKSLDIREEAAKTLIHVTLKDLLTLSLERNLTLQSSQLGEQLAQYTLSTAQNRNLFILKNALSRDRSLSPSFGVDNFMNLSRTDSTVVSSTLSKKGSNGIQYGVTYVESQAQVTPLSIAKEGDSPIVGSTRDPLNTSVLTGFVSIPIFQDWGEDLNDIPVRLGEIGVDSSQISTRQNQLTVLRTISTHYWNLVILQETLRVQQEAVLLSERLLQERQIQRDAGVLSATEVKITETQLAKEKQAFLSTELDFLKLSNTLRADLNLDQDSFEFRPKEQPQIHEIKLSFEQWLQKVYAHDPTLQLLQNSMKQNQQELVEVRNQDKTNLDLDLAYSVNGYSSNSFGGTGGFSESEQSGFKATLTWTVPLFDHVTPQNIKKKEIEFQQILLQTQQLKSTLHVQLQSLMSSLTLIKQDIETARSLTKLAEEQLANEMERLKQGQSTSFQVSQFQQQVTEAKQNEILSKVRYEQTYMELLLLSNEIFVQYDLSLSK